MNLAFSARHKGISTWALTQQMTSFAKPFREITAALVLFNIQSTKDMKIILESYAVELTREEKKSMIDGLKSIEYLHFFFFSLCHRYSIDLKISPSAI